MCELIDRTDALGGVTGDWLNGFSKDMRRRLWAIELESGATRRMIGRYRYDTLTRKHELGSLSRWIMRWRERWMV